MSARPYKPSARRRAEARNEGRVPRSSIVTALASVAAVGGLAVAVGGEGWAVVRGLAQVTWYHAGQVSTIAELGRVSALAVEALASLVLPVAIVAALGAAVAGFLQVGPLFATRAVRVDMGRLGRRPFDGPGALVALVLAVCLVLVVGDALWSSAPAVSRLSWAPESAVLVARGALLSLGLRVAAVCAAVGAVDFLWRRHRSEHDLHMTRAEWLREQRAQRGDPSVRRAFDKQRRAAVDPASVGSLQAGELAIAGHGVVVVGRVGDDVVPTVLAVGRGLLGDHLLADARAAAIPGVHDPELAAVLAQVRPGRPVPRAHFGALARHLVSSRPLTA